MKRMMVASVRWDGKGWEQRSVEEHVVSNAKPQMNQYRESTERTV